MKLSQLISKGSYTLVCGDPNSNREVTTAYTGDLLSDVMANMEDDAILITIQVHKNSIAVAGLKNAPAILFCNNRSVSEDVIEAANREGITLLTTEDTQFISSIKIGKLLDLAGL